MRKDRFKDFRGLPSLPAGGRGWSEQKQQQHFAVAPGMVDIQQMPLYDTWTTGPVTPGGPVVIPPIQFFTVPIGTIGSGFTTAKTQVQTNMTDTQRLQAPRSFEVHAMRIYWAQSIAIQDAEILYNTLNAVLIVGEKPYQQAPIWFFPAGGGVTGAPAVSLYAQAAPTKALYTNWQNGECNPMAINLIAQPFLIKIEQGENFRVELQGVGTIPLSGTTLIPEATGVTIVCALDGILTRQVQ